MRLEKKDMAYISELLRELHAIKQGDTMGNDAWEYAKKISLLSEAMCNDDAIEVKQDMPFPVAEYVHG